MDYTSEQRAAIETHDRNVIVIAGAGSGKTRVLADRFVALLKAHPEWPVASLAAITFTDKAALELRARIRTAIEDQITHADSVELRSFWRKRSVSLDGARIGTIHSLCSIIVRANAALWGIDPGFEVLDEAESAVMRDAALDETLVALTEYPAARLFTHYPTDALRKSLKGALDQPIMEALTALDTATLMSQSQVLYEQIAAEVLSHLRSDQTFLEALNWQPHTQPDPNDRLTPIWDQFAAQRDGWQNADSVQRIALLNIWATAIKINVGAAAAWNGELVNAKATLRTIRDGAKWAVGEMGEPFGEYDQLAAELLPHWMAAIRLSHDIYQQHKRRARALDFADLESFACELLKQDGVRRRYQAEFNHVLVDEFQDTNAAQRDIVYGLTGYRPGSLFVVGDPKQAIYGFRGADVAVFEQVRREIVESGGIEINLSTSFRPHRALVGAHNHAFTKLLVHVEGNDYTVGYGKPMSSPRAAASHHVPAIEIIGLADQYVPKESRKADPMRQLEARVLAERLNALKTEQWPVWDRQTSTYRPIEYGDCAVLVRASASMLFIEEAVKALHIPYVTIAGKGYYDRPEIRDVLALLMALYSPADELALATVLRSPLYSLSDDALYCLRLSAPDSPLWMALNAFPFDLFPELSEADTESIRFARESLTHLRGLAGRVTVAELIQHVLDDTAFPAVLVGLPDGVRRVGNLQKLLDMARRAGSMSLGDFLVWMEDLSDRELREGEAPVETGGAVNIMTIHASKGLEFPVVALFDTSRHSRSNESALWVWDRQLGPACCVRDESDKTIKPVAYRLAERYAAQRENAERLRLLYVAMTRAADRLIVTGRVAKKSDEAVKKSLIDQSWLEQLCSVFGLPDDVPLTPGEPLHSRYEWGEVHYYAPGNLVAVAESLVVMEASAVDTSTDPTITNILSHEPELLRSIDYRPDSAVQSLAATAVAMLGQAHALKTEADTDGQPSDRFARLRRHLVNAAPPSIPDIIPAADNAIPDDHPPNRIIGEIVHRALQFGVQVSAPDAANQLKIYAWQVGLTDPTQVEYAVREAIRLLESNEQSEIVQRLRKAVQAYRELPFSLRWGERTINGQIDALYLERGGRWVVLDYKTDDVPEEFVHGHARRYLGQVGVYAAAVEQLTGQAPRVFLHYIRPGVTVAVREADWRAALARLETELQTALTDPAITKEMRPL